MSPVPPFASGRAAAAARLRLCTLGAALVHVGRVQVTPSSGVLFALLVRLAHSPGMSVTRDQLVAELWPGFDPGRQRANLRQALYKLRSMGVRLSAGHAVVALDPAQLAPSFALERSAALFQGQVLTHAEPFGPFLPGFVPEGEELAEWVELQRGVVHGDVRHVLVGELRERREAGDWSGTEAVARALLRFDPLNEEGTLQLAECVMLAGAKAEAVAILDRYLAELGAVPPEVGGRAEAMRRRFQDPPPRRVREREPQDRHFVGRSEELELLAQGLRRARWQDGGAVLVHGAPGIGKTRLAQALSQVAATEGFREVRMACRDGDQVNRYHLLATLVPRLLALPGALGCEPSSLQRLRAQWPEPGAEAAAPVPVDPATSGDPVVDFVQQAATREALLDLMAAVAEERPLLLVVEDVHWLDAGSWQVLQLFVSATGALRLLVVVTARERTPQALRGIAPSPRQAVLALGPLAPAAVQELAEGVAAEYALALPEAVAARLAAVSEGNPLFLRALVKHWVDTGEAEGVPGTLTQLLEARLDRLPPTALTVLQTIVALGPLARVERLREAVGVATLALVSALETLEQADCIRPMPPYHVASHDLVGRLAWARLSPPAAAVLSGAVAEVLEREYWETADGALLPAVLAGLAASGRGDRFGRLLVEVQGAVLACGNPAPVLAQAERLVATGPSGWMREEVRHVLAQLQAQAGNYAESLRLAGGVPALPRGEAELDERTAAAMLSYLDSAYRSDVTHDVDFAAEAITRLSELPHLPPRLRLECAKSGIVIAANQASLPHARRCFATLKALRPEYDRDDVYLSALMIFHTSFGAIDEAKRIALAMVEALPSEITTIKDLFRFDNVAFALRYCGMPEQSAAIFRRTHQAAFDLGVPLQAEFSALQLALMSGAHGEEESFSFWLDRLKAIHQSTRMTDIPSPVLGIFLRAALQAKKKKEAEMLLSHLRATIGPNTATKAKAYIAAVEIAVPMLESSWKPSREQVDVSVQRLKAIASLGLNDYTLLLNLQALTAVGRSDEAVALAVQFFSGVRRDREKVLPELRKQLWTMNGFPHELLEQ